MQADPLAGIVPRIGTVHHGYVHVRHRAQARLMFVCVEQAKGSAVEVVQV